MQPSLSLKPGIPDEKNIRFSDYTESLIAEAYRVNLIDRTERERLKNEMAEILRENIRRYTSSLSSSVSVDTSEDMLESVLFCLDALLVRSSSFHEALDLLRNSELSLLYYRGVRLVRSYVFKSAGLFVRVKKHMVSVDDEAYRFTLDSRIRAILSSYDIFYAAHKLQAYPDYHTLLMPHKLRGIFFLIRYLQNLYAENLFCGKFPAGQVETVRQNCSPDVKNFFFPSLSVALAQVLGDGDICSLDLADETALKAAKAIKRLSEAERRALILESAASVSAFDAPFVREYVVKCADRNSFFLSEAIREGNPVLVRPTDGK